jgi:hypothetical protein
LSADITLYFNKERGIYTSDVDRDPENGCTPGRRKYQRNATYNIMSAAK